ECWPITTGAARLRLLSASAGAGAATPVASLCARRHWEPEPVPRLPCAFVSTHPTPSGRRTAAAVAVLVIALAVASPVLLTAIGARQKPGSDPKAIPVADALAELARSFS